MIEFEPVTEQTLEIALEIVNSNSDYNLLENGEPSRSLEDITEFLDIATDSFFIKIDKKHIGIIDYLKNNPKDHYPWIGLLMIHGDAHFKGYGKKAFYSFEERLKRQEVSNVRLGVLRNNLNARSFWTSIGFKKYGTSEWQGKIVDCYEKNLDAD